MTAADRSRILLVLLDFPRWEEARAWSYTGSYALVDGLEANGVDVSILPAYGRMPSFSPASWLSRARYLYEGESFDQVWIWLLHVPYDDDFLGWIAGLAPVRLGLICESLVYGPNECTAYPPLKDYRSVVLRQIKELKLTHVLAVDEADVAEIASNSGAKAAWWPACITQRFVSDGYCPPVNRAVAFYGNVYNSDRLAVVHRLGARGLLVHGTPPEGSTSLPSLFNALHMTTGDHLLRGHRSDDKKILDHYILAVRTVRQQIFLLWMQALQNWTAVANLPSFVKCYTGRVVEAMAAGRPVITWRVPDRPRNEALFEDGAEILLYERSDHDQLERHIKTLQARPDLGRCIAERARDKVLRYHTAEVRVRQILDWIDTGAEPEYGEGRRWVRKERSGEWAARP